MSAKDIILPELEKITRTDKLRRKLDLPVFDENLSDLLSIKVKA
jgi:hypothetical protein